MTPNTVTSTTIICTLLLKFTNPILYLSTPLGNKYILLECSGSSVVLFRGIPVDPALDTIRHAAAAAAGRVSAECRLSQRAVGHRLRLHPTGHEAEGGTSTIISVTETLL